MASPRPAAQRQLIGDDGKALGVAILPAHRPTGGKALEPAFAELVARHEIHPPFAMLTLAAAFLPLHREISKSVALICWRVVFPFTGSVGSFQSSPPNFSEVRQTERLEQPRDPRHNIGEHGVLLRRIERDPPVARRIVMRDRRRQYPRHGAMDA
jgi:hypothetical protein